MRNFIMQLQLVHRPQQHIQMNPLQLLQQAQGHPLQAQVRS